MNYPSPPERVPMPAPPRDAPREEVAFWAVAERLLRDLETAAAAGAIVTLKVRFRHLVGPDQDPWRSTKRKAKRASATSFAGSLQLFGKGASAARLLEQLGADPLGKLEEWASERTDGGEAEGVTSVEVFVVGKIGGPWPTDAG
jgi:hypothetical protein